MTARPPDSGCAPRVAASPPPSSRKRFLNGATVRCREGLVKRIRFLDSSARVVRPNGYRGQRMSETISQDGPSQRSRDGRRATMKEVAALAGVSLSTVSRVVTDDPAVRADLVEKVRRAVGVLDYRHNATATALRRNDGLSSSIGVIVEDVTNPFFSAVQRGIEEVARERGVLTFAGSSDEQPGREQQLAAALGARRGERGLLTFAGSADAQPGREQPLAEALGARGVDGLIIAPAGGDNSYLLRERATGTALVFVDRPGRFIDADAVLPDNFGGAAGAGGPLGGAGAPGA